METRKIPDTDLEVSRLVLGCMGLGGGWVADTKLTTDHERQAREFLDAAEEIGANFFDHANIYGRGRAEEVFGRVLKERPYLRDRIVLQSKCGIRWVDDPPGTPMRYDFSHEHILESVDAILGRLGTDRLDILLLPGPTRSGKGRKSPTLSGNSTVLARCATSAFPTKTGFNWNTCNPFCPTAWWSTR
jgi:aryl-alcohol dehydrogenase-like predicted oxidoreductase